MTHGLQDSEGASQSGSEDALSGSEEDDEDASEKSEDDDATLEKKAKVRQFTSEIKTLESAIEKKRAGFAGGNPIMMVSIITPIEDAPLNWKQRNGSRRPSRDYKEISRQRSRQGKRCSMRWR